VPKRQGFAPVTRALDAASYTVKRTSPNMDVFHHAQADLKEQFADVCVEELSIDFASGRKTLSYAGWS